MKAEASLTYALIFALSPLIAKHSLHILKIWMQLLYFTATFPDCALLSWITGILTAFAGLSSLAVLLWSFVPAALAMGLILLPVRRGILDAGPARKACEGLGLRIGRTALSGQVVGSQRWAKLSGRALRCFIERLQ